MLFEKATREKFRFDFKGNCTVEDLWDLSLTNLDTIYRNLKREENAKKEESLLETKSKADETLEAKIEIIKHIVTVKQEEAAKKRNEVARKAEKENLLEIINQKENEAKKSLSIDELKKRVAEL